MSEGNNLQQHKKVQAKKEKEGQGGPCISAPVEVGGNPRLKEEEPCDFVEKVQVDSAAVAEALDRDAFNLNRNDPGNSSDEMLPVEVPPDVDPAWFKEYLATRRSGICPANLSDKTNNQNI